MDDRITIYYYTAWDGYAWQGCDKEEAAALQKYIDVTGTLPRTATDKPPFGGAAPCVIGSVTGVAVYRYHIRKNGDAAGRDSLYISLAFIPLGLGRFDLEKILSIPQMSEPRQGRLEKEFIDSAGLELPEGDRYERWCERDGDVPGALRGSNGLYRASGLFFSKATQLGFLAAVFECKGGLDRIEIKLEYSVYPEVEEVVKAANAIESARNRAGKRILPKDSPEANGMKRALAGLKEWADRQRAYPGLEEYWKFKTREQSDDDIRKIKEYAEETEGALAEANAAGYDEYRSKRVSEKCARLAERFSDLPVFDCREYQKAAALALKAGIRAAEIRAALEREEMKKLHQREMDRINSENLELRKRLKNRENTIKQPGITDRQAQMGRIVATGNLATRAVRHKASGKTFFGFGFADLALMALIAGGLIVLCVFIGKPIVDRPESSVSQSITAPSGNNPPNPSTQNPGSGNGSGGTQNQGKKPTDANPTVNTKELPNVTNDPKDQQPKNRPENPPQKTEQIATQKDPQPTSNNLTDRNKKTEKGKQDGGSTPDQKGAEKRLQNGQKPKGEANGGQ